MSKGYVHQTEHAALLEARSIIHAMKSGVDMSDVFTGVESGYRGLVQENVDRLIKEGDVIVTQPEEAETSTAASPANSEALGTLQIEEEDLPEETEAPDELDAYEW